MNEEDCKNAFLGACVGVTLALNPLLGVALVGLAWAAGGEEPEEPEEPEEAKSED